MFDEWLTNLRKQGDVEVLDPSLESEDPPEAPATEPPAPNNSPNQPKPGAGKGGSQ